MMSMHNPYEADPDKIPLDDPYREEPFYGRHLPLATDFTPEPQHVNSKTPESFAYCLSVLSQCTSQNRIYENETGGRDVFALGSVIVKSTHLKHNQDRDYALADANEVAATALAKPVLEKMGIRVPQIYFADKIQGRSVLVQERIPGVGLNVAWRYLAAPEKSSFKEQAREILEALRNVLGAGPAYIVADPDPVTHRGVQPLERDILFDSRGAQNKACALFHNDLSQSNLIVDRGKIVAIVDWEMAGFFTWDAIKEVHLRIRSPSEKTYGHLNLPQKVLDDIYFWNDLYD